MVMIITMFILIIIMLILTFLGGLMSEDCVVGSTFCGLGVVILFAIIMLSIQGMIKDIASIKQENVKQQKIAQSLYNQQ